MRQIIGRVVRLCLPLGAAISALNGADDVARRPHAEGLKQ